VSFGRSDAAFAQELAQMLSLQGLRVWIDREAPRAALSANVV
jgi:hypothetical protein